ncbi:hypothetical protein AB0J72_19855 [Dactylosporangium sp. NPDC049742]|uniref:hypothetical protein n=1 Tax=Dactylosporangium sp. NPDC049742 TaxID=3154737 RepID=UPI00343E9F64
MSGQCGQCPALHAEIARLRGVVAVLEQRIAVLRALLSNALGAVRGCAEFIDRELTEPTMPRARLLPAVAQRLVATAEDLEGRNR